MVYKDEVQEGDGARSPPANGRDCIK